MTNPLVFGTLVSIELIVDKLAFYLVTTLSYTAFITTPLSTYLLSLFKPAGTAAPLFSCEVLYLGAVKLTKNANTEKYFHFGMAFHFNCVERFHHQMVVEFGKNLITFRVDNSSFAHFDKSKDILILGRG